MNKRSLNLYKPTILVGNAVFTKIVLLAPNSNLGDFSSPTAKFQPPSSAPLYCRYTTDVNDYTRGVAVLVCRCYYLLLLLFPTHLLSAVENAVKRISCINSLFSFHVPAFDQSIINQLSIAFIYSSNQKNRSYCNEHQPFLISE
jgi:hypothetical protein